MCDRVRINNQETPVLQALAANVPENGLIVEIGACWGYSASKMAAAARETVRIITIDPWTLAPQKQQAEREALFHQTIKPYRDKILPIKAFSQDVDIPAVLGNREIDLLFVDGNHHYEPVFSDCSRYAPCVRMGGVLVFHDYVNDKWPGVKQAVDELAVSSGLWDWHTEMRFWIGTRIAKSET